MAPLTEATSRTVGYIARRPIALGWGLAAVVLAAAGGAALGHFTTNGPESSERQSTSTPRSDDTLTAPSNDVSSHQPSRAVSTVSTGSPLPIDLTPAGGDAPLAGLACENVATVRNGRDLLPSESDAPGSLLVENGTSQDALLVLLDEQGEQARAMFIQAGHRATLRHVEVGTYRVDYVLGSGFDVSTWVFCSEGEASEFDREIAFRENLEADTLHYSTYRLTLHAVPEGNATVHRANASLLRRGASKSVNRVRRN